MEVADILRAQGNRFLDRYKKSFSFQQLKAFRAIQNCRTAALGGHLDACLRCGHQAISYNSCRNRHCPKCQAKRANNGSKRVSEKSCLPPTFTWSSPCRTNSMCWRLRTRSCSTTCCFAAAATLLQVAANPKHLGAEIGFFGVLHTWGQNLLQNPHS